MCQQLNGIFLQFLKINIAIKNGSKKDCFGNIKA